jgi:hypothetical protein
MPSVAVSEDYPMPSARSNDSVRYYRMNYAELIHLAQIGRVIFTCNPTIEDTEVEDSDKVGESGQARVISRNFLHSGISLLMLKNAC